MRLRLGMKTIGGKLRTKIAGQSLEIPYFQIFYSGSYVVLFLILLALLTITPAEFIYQIIVNRKIGNIFVVAATYIVTPLIALFIYASRLYTNRTTLASIPRPYLPIEQDEVSKKVRRIVVQNRERSALVAFESRPRDLSATAEREQASRSSGSLPPGSAADKNHEKSQDVKKGALPQISATSPPWGVIRHAGWSPPSAEDVPDLEFQTVYTELPNLIEAKVVALVSSYNDLHPESRRESIEHFTRPVNMGMRDYLNRLRASNVTLPPNLVAVFLSKYEAARFSARPISEPDFRDLMKSFSNILPVIQLSTSLDDSRSNSSESMESVESASNASISRSILTREVSNQSGVYSTASPPMEPGLISPSSSSMNSVVIHRGDIASALSEALRSDL